jgi:hypothetical protein
MNPQWSWKSSTSGIRTKKQPRREYNAFAAIKDSAGGGIVENEIRYGY